MKQIMLNKIINKIREFFNPTLFVMQIDKTKSKKISGTVAHAFIVDCTDIAQDLNINDGKIWVKKNDEYPKLYFSNNIPKSSYQRFRNAYNFSKK